MCIVYCCILLIRAYVCTITNGWVESCVIIFDRQVPVSMALLRHFLGVEPVALLLFLYPAS